MEKLHEVCCKLHGQPYIPKPACTTSFCVHLAAFQLARLHRRVSQSQSAKHVAARNLVASMALLPEFNCTSRTGDAKRFSWDPLTWDDSLAQSTTGRATKRVSLLGLLGLDARTICNTSDVLQLPASSIFRLAVNDQEAHSEALRERRCTHYPEPCSPGNTDAVGRIADLVDELGCKIDPNEAPTPCRIGSVRPRALGSRSLASGYCIHHKWLARNIRRQPEACVLPTRTGRCLWYLRVCCRGLLGAAVGSTFQTAVPWQRSALPALADEEGRLRLFCIYLP